MSSNNKTQRVSPSKKAKRKSAKNGLCNRIMWASQDLDIIMKDLQRDCKPYYKIIDLVRELEDISHEAKELTKDNTRLFNLLEKTRAEIRAVQAEVKEKLKNAEIRAEKLKNVV